MLQWLDAMSVRRRQPDDDVDVGGSGKRFKSCDKDEHPSMSVSTASATASFSAVLTLSTTNTAAAAAGDRALVGTVAEKATSASPSDLPTMSKDSESVASSNGAPETAFVLVKDTVAASVSVKNGAAASISVKDGASEARVLSVLENLLSAGYDVRVSEHEAATKRHVAEIARQSTEIAGLRAELVATQATLDDANDKKATALNAVGIDRKILAEERSRLMAELETTRAELAARFQLAAAHTADLEKELSTLRQRFDDRFRIYKFEELSGVSSLAKAGGGETISALIEQKLGRLVGQHEVKHQIRMFYSKLVLRQYKKRKADERKTASTSKDVKSKTTDERRLSPEDEKTKDDPKDAKSTDNWRLSLAVDSMVWAHEGGNGWYAARVVTCQRRSSPGAEGARLKVNYIGLSSDYDEWFDSSSAWLAPRDAPKPSAPPAAPALDRAPANWRRMLAPGTMLWSCFKSCRWHKNEVATVKGEYFSVNGLEPTMFHRDDDQFAYYHPEHRSESHPRQPPGSWFTWHSNGGCSRWAWCMDPIAATATPAAAASSSSGGAADDGKDKKKEQPPVAATAAADDGKDKKKERPLVASDALSVFGHPGHFVLTGPPGTGKTTVARILRDALMKLDLVNSNFVEANGNDLSAENVGGTKVKVHALFDRARGGVLFIDEAYGSDTTHTPFLCVADDDWFYGFSVLNTIKNAGDTGHSFGQEAIEALMSHLSPTTGAPTCVVVLAGYADPMRRFLQQNEGLSRRLQTRMRFESYTTDELVEITERVFADKGERLALDPDLKDTPPAQAARLILHDAIGRLTPQTIDQQNAAVGQRMLEEAETARAERLHPHLASLHLDPDIVDQFTRPDLIAAATALNRASAKPSPSSR